MSAEPCWNQRLWHSAREPANKPSLAEFKKACPDLPHQCNISISFQDLIAVLMLPSFQCHSKPLAATIAFVIQTRTPLSVVPSFGKWGSRSDCHQSPTLDLPATPLDRPQESQGPRDHRDAIGMTWNLLWIKSSKVSIKIWILTAKAPENRPVAPKGNYMVTSIPSIHFQVQNSTGLWDLLHLPMVDSLQHQGWTPLRGAETSSSQKKTSLPKAWWLPKTNPRCLGVLPRKFARP